MNTKSLQPHGLPDDDATVVTKADFEHLQESLGRMIRYEIARLEDHLRKSFLGDALRTVDEHLRTRSLEAFLGNEPVLEERHRSIDEMLAPFLLDESGKTRLLAEDPDMLDAVSFAARLGFSPQGLHEKRKRGEVLGLAQAKKKIWFPKYQIDENGKILKGLPNVIAAFDKDPWPAHRFLTTPQDALDGLTGREALAAGRIEEVLTAVRG
jgi:hypothetical protein